MGDAISYGWCAPSSFLTELFASNEPVDPPAPCEGQHRWVREPTGHGECCEHGPLVRVLECEDYVVCRAVLNEDADGFDELWETAEW